MALNSLSSFLIEWVSANPVEAGIASTVVLPLLYVIANEFVRYGARIKGFNGPAGLPLIGVIWHVSGNAAEQYRVWSKKYGGVFQVQLGNVPVIVVNDAASAKTIFGSNSQALASRPETYTFHKVCSSSRLIFGTGTNAVVGLVQYGRHHNRYISLQRIVEEKAQGRSVSFEQAVHCDIRWTSRH